MGCGAWAPRLRWRRCPPGRGFFSGLLQEGYVVGNLLAAALFGLLFPHLHGSGMLTNWRVLFMIGALPALLAFYLQYKVEESPVWLASRSRRRRRHIAFDFEPQRLVKSSIRYLPSFLFLVVLMTAFTSFSHGTQDLYPTFLLHDRSQRRATSA